MSTLNERERERLASVGLLKDPTELSASFLLWASSPMPLITTEERREQLRVELLGE